MNKTALKKLHNIYELEEKALKKYHLTGYEYDLIYDIGNDYINNGYAITINTRLAELCKQIGFNVTPKGIGFKII